MKKLTNTFLLASALAVLTISCNKDPLPSNRIVPNLPTPQPPPPPVVSMVTISGSSADLMLHLQSSIPLSNPQTISISGILEEEFNNETGHNKTWKLSNLSPGIYRATLQLGKALPYPQQYYYYFSLRFEITDKSGTQNLSPTQLGPSIYAFDLVVKK